MHHKVGEYNTEKENVVLKEYGRNIQNLVKYLCTIQDRERRNQGARALIELMKQINPGVRESTEDFQKLWDDLYIMSDFALEIDGPFPKPERSILNRKPQRIPYKNKEIMYKHYGLNIQLLVEKIMTLESDEDRDSAIIYLGRLIKSFSSLWNKENLDDGSVLENIVHLSGGKLKIDLQRVRDNNLFDSLTKEKPRSNNNNGQMNHPQHGQQRHHRKGKRKRI